MWAVETQFAGSICYLSFKIIFRKFYANSFLSKPNIEIDDFDFGFTTLSEEELKLREKIVIDGATGAANAKLISPFVGRITDWYKNKLGTNWSDANHGGANDPGVTSVKKIFHYYKQYGIATEIMGASFRNTSQILELAGCDLLTISPELLAELQNSNMLVSKKLDAGHTQKLEALKLDESSFRLQLNNDPMATEKLAEGIRNFCIDTEKLEALLTK